MAKTLKMVLAGDSTSAVKAIAATQNELGKFTGSLAGLSSRGGGAWNGLSKAMASSGIPGQFAELQTAVGGLQGAFELMGEKGKTSFAKIATGVGLAIGAVGGVAKAASIPLADANAALRQSLENVGSSWDEYAGRIAEADQHMERFGHRSSDTNAALAKMVAAFQDPEEAFKRLAELADLSARTGDTLTTSTGTFAKVFGGSTRPLKAFGINLKDTTELGVAAEKAVKSQTKAQEDLAKATQNLTDLNARLAESSSKQDTSGTDRVATAEERLAKAGDHLQEVQAKVTDGHTSEASAISQLQNARDRVTDALKDLDEAQNKARAGAKMSVGQEQELRKAHEAVDKAQKDVIKTDKEALRTRDDLGKATVPWAQALDMIHQRTKGLAEAQADTFGGKLRAAKAAVTDFAATVGAKFGNALIVAGPALAGIGGLVQSNIIGKSAQGIAALVRFSAASAVWAVEMLANAGMAALGWAAQMTAISSASEASAAATTAAWATVFARLFILVTVVTYFAKHWKEAWQGFKLNAQAAANGVLDAAAWILSSFDMLARGISSMLELATHIPGVGDRFTGMADAARASQRQLTEWIDMANKGVDFTADVRAEAAAAKALTADTLHSLITVPVLPPGPGALAGNLPGGTRPFGAPAPTGPAVPSVAHISDTHDVNLMGPITIQPADLDALRKELDDALLRQNFSGEGATPATVGP